MCSGANPAINLLVTDHQWGGVIKAAKAALAKIRGHTLDGVAVGLPACARVQASALSTQVTIVNVGHVVSIAKSRRSRRSPRYINQMKSPKKSRMLFIMANLARHLGNRQRSLAA
jgi:hypothetical protein